MKLDITWTITAIIAVSSFLSPIVVAIINNYHQIKIRTIELKHAEYVHQLDLQHAIDVKQFDIYYADKKQAFSDFSRAAGSYFFSKGVASRYSDLCAATHTAMLFCSKDVYRSLADFLVFIDTIYGYGDDAKLDRMKYTQLLSSLVDSLNSELASTKPVVQRESSER